MARPPERFKALRICAFWVAFIVLLLPGCALALVIFFLSTPYTLFHYSFHWGLRKRDFASIQFYLDHFEALHPELMTHVSRYFSSPAFAQTTAPRAIKFWPTLTRQHDIEGIPFIVIIHTTRYTFSIAAGLFFSLEQSGFPRKHLYTLLKHEVESNVPSVTAEDKANFQHPMDTICEHDLFAKVVKPTGGGKGFTLPMEVGEKVIPVRSCAVGWIIDEPGALVAPMDSATLTRFRNLTRQFPIWKRIDKDADILTGVDDKWQMLDMR